MISVFIGGSRCIRRLTSDVQQRLARIVANGHQVLIGDANGADKAVQDFLKDQHYARVEVFCAEGVCRNNTGGWPVRGIPVAKGVKGALYYAAKDRVMAKEASVGLMIWDGSSTGTLANVQRLLSLGKKVVVYVSPARSSTTLSDEADWKKFLAVTTPEIQDRLQRLMAVERTPAETAHEPATLF